MVPKVQEMARLDSTRPVSETVAACMFTPAFGDCVPALKSDRAGPNWLPATKISALVCAGGVELDFRSADMPESVEVNAYSCCGGIDVIFPPDTKVEVTALSCCGPVMWGIFDTTPCPQLSERYNPRYLPNGVGPKSAKVKGIGIWSWINALNAKPDVKFGCLGPAPNCYGRKNVPCWC